MLFALVAARAAKLPKRIGFLVRICAAVLTSALERGLRTKTSTQNDDSVFRDLVIYFSKSILVRYYMVVEICNTVAIHK